ncbi:MAG TPA: transporter substrate-binding domain-containing protein [Rhodocyclaceae bacterium]|nr:transporter substrate-binding domain-containing protein [Rhodocyclaceae bacterium]
MSHPSLMRHALLCGLLLLGALVSSAADADQLTDIKAANRIRVAIINGLSNFSYQDPKRGFVGSDVEAARLLAKDLGVAVEFVYVANAGRIDTLLASKADIILSALSITPERERAISFSVPYSVIALVIGAPKQLPITGYRDLAGKKVGVGRNTSDGMLLKQNTTGVAILEYEDEHALLEGYAKRQFDIISAQRADIDEVNRLVPDRPIEEKFVQKEFEVAVGIRKSERGLREWINSWTAKNLGNGRLNEIYRRYHGQDLPETVMPRTLGR